MPINLRKHKTLPPTPTISKSRKHKTLHSTSKKSYLDDVEPYYESGGLLEKFLLNFSDSAVVLIDIDSGFNERNEDNINGSRSYVVGLLNKAMEKNVPIIQVEIDKYELCIPKILKDYEHYIGFNKKESGCNLSAYCVIGDFLKTKEINNLFIAGKTRECCVLSTIYGELKTKKSTIEIKENSAAIEDYNCYTGSAYTRPSSYGGKFPINDRINIHRENAFEYYGYVPLAKAIKHFKKLKKSRKRKKKIKK